MHGAWNVSPILVGGVVAGVLVAWLLFLIFSRKE